jgi:hypothetical protein
MNVLTIWAGKLERWLIVAPNIVIVLYMYRTDLQALPLRQHTSFQNQSASFTGPQLFLFYTSFKNASDEILRDCWFFCRRKRVVYHTWELQGTGRGYRMPILANNVSRICSYWPKNKPERDSVQVDFSKYFRNSEASFLAVFVWMGNNTC